jgi:uncharacterized repeat protein (TIGR03803 family)
MLSFTPAKAAPAETVLYNFTGSLRGGTPVGVLVADAAGNLYGTASTGGVMKCAGGCGVVFELSPPANPGGKWVETVLHGFKGGADGQTPVSGLVFDAHGALYGTTASGGGTSTQCKSGCGTAFKLTPTAAKGQPWTEQVLYAFKGGAGGELPLTGMIIDAKGALYGTTGKSTTGNVSACIGAPCGTVFKLTPPAGANAGWTYSALHIFKGGTDGSLPLGGLVADKDGALYGTTALGGSSHCFSFGCGAVYRLTPPVAGKTDWVESVIYAFAGGPGEQGTNDGAYANSDLIADARGNLYGTTYYGPDSDCGNEGCGIAFKVKPPLPSGSKGVETVLYGFQSATDGASPIDGRGRLAMGASGALYGTTPAGGAASSGTVFKLTPMSNASARWTKSVVYTFQGGTDGGAPQGGLIRVGTALYGTTSAGGRYGAGTVFRVNP